MEHMPDEKSYSYPLDLHTSLFNPDGALLLAAYQKLAESVTEQHLRNICLDAPTMLERYGATWVLLAMSFELRRPIRPEDALLARTWHAGRQRSFYRREIVFYDSTGAEAAVAACFSTLMDLESRRMVSLKELEAATDAIQGEQLQRAGFHCRPDLTRLQRVETLRARPSWIDGLGHVNNTRYGDFAYDALPEAERRCLGDLSRLEFYFMRELQEGDSFEILRDVGEREITVCGCREERPSFAVRLCLGAAGEERQ